MTAPRPGPPGPPPGWPAQPPSWGQGYPPPSPGYGYPPPGYGYPPPGYGRPMPAPAWKPGIIALRPLSLSDIFNGAVAYVRANPKPTLGLTTVVVLFTTVVGFLTRLAAARITGDAAGVAGLVTGGSAMLLAATLLSGMLTTIVARSVLGGRITAAEAWRRVRGRMPALIGLTLLEIIAVVALIAAVVLTIVGIAAGAGGGPAALIGVPLVLTLIAALAVLYGVLALAPVTIVLENKGIAAAVRRSVALSRPRFWRIVGVLLLSGLVTALVSGAISIPFDIAGSVIGFSTSGQTRSASIGQTAIIGIGQAIGQILTTPFVAGVVTLLYVDARIRSEAFDFTLLRAAPNGDDSVWLHQ